MAPGEGAWPRQRLPELHRPFCAWSDGPPLRPESAVQACNGAAGASAPAGQRCGVPP